MTNPHHPLRFIPTPTDLARKFCMLGATDDDLARLLEVPRETLDAWLAEVPAFAIAVKAGRDVADATVAERLYARAIGYSHEATKIFNNKGEIVREEYTEHYPPDVQAAIFWLRARRPEWRDKGGADAASDATDLLAELDAAGERLRHVRR